MGIKSITVVVLNKNNRVAQYGQLDGSPLGQGVVVLNFLKDKMNREIFSQNLTKCSWISEERYRDLWVSCGATTTDDWVDEKIHASFKKKYPYLDYDCGANVLNIIQNNEIGMELKNSIDFSINSIFCEWIYVVDLDKNVFEIYKGFNKTPLSKEDRFYYNGYKERDYYPAKIVKEYDLNDLPSVEEFVNYFKY